MPACSALRNLLIDSYQANVHGEACELMRLKMYFIVQVFLP